MRKYIPNLLTRLRMVLAFVLLALGCTQISPAWVLGLVFILAAATDMEGFLARLWGVESDWGARWDPRADKILVGATLFVVLWQVWPEGWIFFVLLAMAVINIGRDAYVDGILRPKTAKLGGELKVLPSAKWKTATQMAALFLLLLGGYGFFIYVAGLVLLLVASGLALYSLFLYQRQANALM